MKMVGNNVTWFPGANQRPSGQVLPEQIEPEKLQQMLMFQHWQAVYQAATEVGPSAVLIEVLDADPQLKKDHLPLYLRAKVTYGAYLEREARAQQQLAWTQARRQQRRERIVKAWGGILAAVRELLPKRMEPDLARQRLDLIAKHAPHLMAQDVSKPKRRKAKDAQPASAPAPQCTQEASQQTGEPGQAAA